MTIFVIFALMLVAVSAQHPNNLQDTHKHSLDPEVLGRYGYSYNGLLYLSPKLLPTFRNNSTHIIEREMKKRASIQHYEPMDGRYVHTRAFPVLNKFSNPTQKVNPISNRVRFPTDPPVEIQDGYGRSYSDSSAPKLNKLFIPVQKEYNTISNRIRFPTDPPVQIQEIPVKSSTNKPRNQDFQTPTHSSTQSIQQQDSYSQVSIFSAPRNVDHLKVSQSVITEVPAPNLQFTRHQHLPIDKIPISQQSQVHDTFSNYPRPLLQQLNFISTPNIKSTIQAQRPISQIPISQQTINHQLPIPISFNQYRPAIQSNSHPAPTTHQTQGTQIPIPQQSINHQTPTTFSYDQYTQAIQSNLNSASNLHQNQGTQIPIPQQSINHQTPTTFSYDQYRQAIQSNLDSASNLHQTQGTQIPIPQQPINNQTPPPFSFNQHTPANLDSASNSYQTQGTQLVAHNPISQQPINHQSPVPFSFNQQTAAIQSNLDHASNSHQTQGTQIPISQQPINYQIPLQFFNNQQTASIQSNLEHPSNKHQTQGTQIPISQQSINYQIPIQYSHNQHSPVLQSNLDSASNLHHTQATQSIVNIPIPQQSTKNQIPVPLSYNQHPPSNQPNLFSVSNVHPTPRNLPIVQIPIPQLSTNYQIPIPVSDNQKTPSTQPNLDNTSDSPSSQISHPFVRVPSHQQFINNQNPIELSNFQHAPTNQYNLVSTTNLQPIPLPQENQPNINDPISETETEQLPPYPTAVSNDQQLPNALIPTQLPHPFSSSQENTNIDYQQPAQTSGSQQPQHFDPTYPQFSEIIQSNIHLPQSTQYPTNPTEQHNPNIQHPSAYLIQNPQNIYGGQILDLQNYDNFLKSLQFPSLQITSNVANFASHQPAQYSTAISSSPITQSHVEIPNTPAPVQDSNKDVPSGENSENNDAAQQQESGSSSESSTESSSESSKDENISNDSPSTSSETPLNKDASEVYNDVSSISNTKLKHRLRVNFQVYKDKTIKNNYSSQYEQTVLKHFDQVNPDVLDQIDKTKKKLENYADHNLNYNSELFNYEKTLDPLNDFSGHKQ